MSDSDEKFIAISINKEIKNLCPDLEPDQQITLANIIDSEFNMEVIYKELETLSYTINIWGIKSISSGVIKVFFFLNLDIFSIL